MIDVFHAFMNVVNYGFDLTKTILHQQIQYVCTTSNMK